ncbi:MAG TPA: S8 family serine peptidase, partial [Anaeromyxobacteraceae bacterium]|nr:S8 family serine peptidase [Anaeromyxobacteraceae bacterium]
MRTTLVLVLVLAANGAATARAAAPTPAIAKKRIERADQLPVHTYAVPNSVSKVLADEKLTAKLASDVRRDLEGDLGAFDIQDAATLREYHGALSRIALLDGRLDDAISHADRVRDLEDKPAVRIISGFVFRAAVAAKRASPAERQATFDATVRKQLASFPYEQVQSELKSAKASLEMQSRNLVMGIVEQQLDPAAKGGTVSKDIAVAVVQMAATMRDILPYKEGAVAALQEVIAAHKVEKPDIWAARNVELPAGKLYSTVNVAVWDGGVDTSLFANRVVEDGAAPAVIAFDRYARPAKGELQPIPAELKDRIPQMKARLKGFSDLQSNIDSAEASEVKQYLSTLKPEQYKGVVEELGLAGNWMHGTHVAGITMAGNPYARLVTGRIEFDWHLLPDPCPSRELVERDARNQQAYVDFFMRHHVRVVNMSWGGSVKGIEEQLELCNIGKTPDERKKIAREYFDIQKAALTKAFASAPQILFVTAAGNSNE